MRLRRGAGERKVGGRDVNGEAMNAERRNKMLNIIKSKRSYIGNKPRSRQTTKRRGRGAEGTRQERQRLGAERREPGGHVDGQEPVHLDLGSAWVAGWRFSRVSSCLIHSRNKAQGRSTEFVFYLPIYLPKTDIKKTRIIMQSRT